MTTPEERHSIPILLTDKPDNEKVELLLPTLVLLFESGKQIRENPIKPSPEVVAAQKNDFLNQARALNEASGE